MELTVGAILDGKVKTITNFGAFILLPDNRTGLVHISEISSSFVNDIHSHLEPGQAVKVKVIAMDGKGKISLSIRRTLEDSQPRPRTDAPRSAPRSAPRQEPSFEEKLKQFISDSDSRISSCRQYEHVTKHRKR